MSSNFFSRVGAFLVIAVGVGLLLSAFFSFVKGPAAPAEVEEEQAPAPAVFQSDAYRFSVTQLSGFGVNESYRYDALGPGREIPGVAFTVPAVLTEGTNLSDDSALSVEVLENVSACTADLFVDMQPDATTQQVPGAGGVTWSVAEDGGAAAGNQYYSKVSATGTPERCYGLRLFAHTTSVANYDPGTVVEYDRASLETAYAALLASFRAF